MPAACHQIRVNSLAFDESSASEQDDPVCFVAPYCARQKALHRLCWNVPSQLARGSTMSVTRSHHHTVALHAWPACCTSDGADAEITAWWRDNSSSLSGCSSCASLVAMRANTALPVCRDPRLPCAKICMQSPAVVPGQWERISQTLIAPCFLLMQRVALVRSIKDARGYKKQTAIDSPLAGHHRHQVASYALFTLFLRADLSVDEGTPKKNC
jgi:hypothetical protein